MEKTRFPNRPPMGPRPVSPRTGRVLSTSRLALLDTLRAQAEPTSLAALIALTGLHRNTVREHMDALIDQGYAIRERAPIKGRGRPAWLYAAKPGPKSEGTEYAGLAGALASVIEQNSEDPEQDAVEAGAEWGRRLAAEAGPPAEPTALGARRQVIKVFEQMGFDPEPDEQAVEVRLTRCPLLEAAHRHPDVVCNVHLGIVRGAMETYGHEETTAELYAFSEPGACRLRLLSPDEPAPDRP